MEVIQAQLEHLDDLSCLFDQYRVFYKASTDIDAARAFLEERLQNQDCVIFLGHQGDRLVGFTQLYPSFSSVSLGKIWILNDLFVMESFRRQGLATLLMSHAENYARETGAIRIGLSTQFFNKGAQALYEARGYLKDNEFWHYSLLRS